MFKKVKIKCETYATGTSREKIKEMHDLHHIFNNFKSIFKQTDNLQVG